MNNQNAKREYTLIPDEDGTVKRSFVVNGGYTSTAYREISKEEYDKYAKMVKSGDLNDYVEKNIISDAVRCGYGFYGARVIEEDGHYFLGVCSGNSCD